MYQQPNIIRCSPLFQPIFLAEFCQYLSYTEICSLLTASPEMRKQLSSKKEVSIQYKLSILRLFLLKDLERHDELLERNVLSQEDLDQLVFSKIYGEKLSISVLEALVLGDFTPLQLQLFASLPITQLDEDVLPGLIKGGTHLEKDKAKNRIVNILRKIRRSQSTVLSEHAQGMGSALSFYALFVSLINNPLFLLALSSFILFMQLDGDDIEKTGLLDCSSFFSAQSNVTHDTCELFSDHALAAQCVG